MSRARGLVLAVLLAGAAGCAHRDRPAALAPPGTPRLREIAERAGVRWVHNPCRTGRKRLPETMGAGGGFLDYNRDGRLDLLLINGAPLPGYRGAAPRHALYRNDGETFTDVSRQAGLDGIGYGMGAAAADYDRDGWTDLYLTVVGRNRLLRNDRGRFVDVTDRAGVGDPRWSTGAAWLDYDGDGHLDLFVANYVEWTPETDIPCGAADEPQYCPPYQYRAARSTLYRNRGDGTFEDVSERAGVTGHPGKTLSAIPWDLTGDGRPDLFLANDTEPDVLLVNRGDGTFQDRAVSAGVAVGTDGRATGSMGADVAAAFGDGRPCLAVGNFVGQGLSLFRPIPGAGEILYDNQKEALGLAAPTLPNSTFGLVFSDVDLDGRADLFVLNGNLDENLGGRTKPEPYRQLPQLFQNVGEAFRDVAGSAGLAEAVVGRGLAVGDFDNDGRQDFLALENGGRARLYRNETPPAGDWLGVALAAAGGGEGTGAVVTASGPGWSDSRWITSARSYLALNDPRAHFGLGRRRLERLEIRWPGGRTTSLSSPALNRYHTVREEG